MSIVDIIVIAVIAISALIAFLRGFVREILTIGSWLGAAIVTLYLFPVLRTHFEDWISNKMAADIVGAVAIFIGSLVVFSVISHFAAGLIRGSALTAVDRSLGLVFGLVRGAVMVSLAYMIVVWLAPSLVHGARTEPMMARGAEILRNLAPRELRDGAPGLPSSLSPASSEAEAGSGGAKPPAYTDRQSDALKRLIDAATTK